MKSAIPEFRKTDPFYELEKIPMGTKYGFCGAMILSFSFSLSRSALLPLYEKQNGIRHMMYLNGLNSFQYWFGMLLADSLISLAPATFGSILAFGFREFLI